MAIVETALLASLVVGLMLMVFGGMIGWFLFNKNIWGVFIMQSIIAIMSIIFLPMVF